MIAAGPPQGDHAAPFGGSAAAKPQAWGDHTLYGLLAEFKDAETLADALGFRRDRIALVTLLGGIVGGVGIYFLQWYSAVIDYPINSGGRPLHSWPAFIPPTFECTVLGAALAAFAGFLILCGLPKLHHPIFNARDFDLATRNRFFLCVEAADPRFDRAGTQRFLESLEPLRVSEVPF